MLPKQYLYRRIVLAKLFIDANFSQPIHLDTISSEAHFSKFHFIRLFRKAYGKTPHQYLTWLRIEQAKLLLASGMPVCDVCFNVGFEEASSFTHLFKRSTGVTPSLYQQQQLERKERIRLQPFAFVPNCFVEQNGWNK